jgi:hypothetical protein
MKSLIKLIGALSLAILLSAPFVIAQDTAVIQRDFNDICPDTLISDGMGGLEGGHFTIPNWFPEGGNGYLAVVSRDDWNLPQLTWDCSNDIVAGSVIEKPIAGQTNSRVTAVLKYELPLEVWTVNDFNAGVRVLDGGFFTANLTRKLVLIGGPGVPLNFNRAYTFSWQITGDGIAFGTGEGEFYEGQMVRVQVTQVGLGIPPVSPNNPNWDAWPVENITLTPFD